MWVTSSLNPKYEVNELGQIRHKETKNRLYGSKDRTGCVIIGTTLPDGTRKAFKLHRMIATEFCEGYDEEHCFVNHKNFDKSDNRAENLEWVTHQENMEHWRQHQSFMTTNEPPLVKRESKHNKGKCPVVQYDLNGNQIAVYESYMTAWRATGVRSGNISNCCRGMRHTAGGYIWRDLIESSTTIESVSE